MKVQFISLGSGSSGNCYYLGTSDCGILIDAGISLRQIRKTLKLYDIDMNNIYAIFVTHDHGDHIRHIETLIEKRHLPIYCTPKVHEGMNRNKHVKHPIYQDVFHIEKEQPFQFRDFTIEAFEVPHDATENVGYCIEIDGKVFTIATDLGEVTPTAAHYLKKANYMVLEANYEEEMLRMGKYPAFLKERVASRTGHLSNSAAAAFLSENYQTNWKYIWLCHLSKDNNHPELAYKAVESRLREIHVCVGKEIELLPLKRTVPSNLYEFE